MTPLLTGKAPANWPDRMIFSTNNKKVSVRTQQYRLDDQGRLYDMVADPSQTKDVAAAQPAMASKLKKAVADWSAEVFPFVGPDDRPFPVGYSKLTWLPARDGRAAGGVERSNKYPNSTFFTKWTSKEGEISWDVEVGKAGDFDVVVEYTCAAADVGSTIEMSLLGKTAKAKVVTAFDPPLQGASNDRVVRIESYYKEFKPLSLGRVSLPKGRGKLTLRATEVAGKQVADVFSVMLYRHM